jgi:hypothetical protein
VNEPDAGVGFGVAPDGGPLAPVVLASGESGPESLALDTSDVYWTANGAGEVRKVSKDGGSPSTVASQANTNPYGVAVGAGNVYWTVPNFYSGGTGAAVIMQSLDGGAPQTMASGVTGPTWIAVGSDDVYWIEEGPGEVVAAPLLGGGSISIASGGSASALALGPHQVFWSAADATYQASLDGSSPLAIGPPAAAIAVDETDVYFAMNSDWSGTGTILRVPVGGGTPTTLATGRTGSVVAIAVDSSNVYWIEGEGTIQEGAVAAMPKGGGYVSILAAGLGDPSAIAVDGTGVYFTNPSGGGNIEKIPKAQ